VLLLVWIRRGDTLALSLLNVAEVEEGTSTVVETLLVEVAASVATASLGFWVDSRCRLDCLASVSNSSCRLDCLASVSNSSGFKLC
jgi:hypothetical protein